LSMFCSKSSSCERLSYALRIASSSDGQQAIGQDARSLIISGGSYSTDVSTAELTARCLSRIDERVKYAGGNKSQGRRTKSDYRCQHLRACMVKPDPL
jgi:hypothetical protein